MQNTQPSTKRRGPGRPKGLGKVPGSGRKPSVPSAISSELRARIIDKYAPLDFLGKVCLGVKIRCGWPPAGPGAKFVYPNLRERIEAATILAAKCLPDLRSSEVTGKDGADLIPKPAPVRLDEKQAAFVAGMAYAETAG